MKKQEKTKKRSDYNNIESYDDEVDIVYELLEAAEAAEQQLLDDFEEFLEELLEFIRRRFPYYFPEGLVNKAGYERLAKDLLSSGDSKSELGEYLDHKTHQLIDTQSLLLMSLFLSDYNLTAKRTDESLGVVSVERDPDAIKSIVLQPWCEDNLTFLDRVKRNTETMDQQLRTVILEGIRNGWSINKMADKLKEITGMAAYKARRLVRTETMAVYSKVTKEIYLEHGIEYIEIIGDAACGGICLDYVGEYLPLAEAEVGLDLPPYHPNCACSFCSYIDFGEIN